MMEQERPDDSQTLEPPGLTASCCARERQARRSNQGYRQHPTPPVAEHRPKSTVRATSSMRSANARSIQYP
jgi:hypothetical protein